MRHFEEEESIIHKSKAEVVLELLKSLNHGNVGYAREGDSAAPRVKLAFDQASELEKLGAVFIDSEPGKESYVEREP